MPAFASIWARDERHYRHLHSSAEWDISEGFVFTSHGEMFQLDRYPPTFFRAARIIKYRVNVPKPDEEDRFLKLYEKTRIATYRLYP